MGRFWDSHPHFGAPVGGHALFLKGGCFPIGGVLTGAASRSSAGLGHPAFFPCLDASGGIGLRWAGCSGCRPLESNSTVQNFGEEWREPGETWGCRRAFAAKLTPNVVEAFSSVPTDGANCCIWDLRHCRASTASMNLQPAKNKQGVRRWFVGPPLRWQSQF